MFNHKNILLKLMFCFTLSACNHSGNDSDTSQNNSHQSDGSKTITSISLAPHLTELIYSAGGGDNIVGISAYSNYPEDAHSKQIIGDAFHLNLELISELEPDVVFYWHNGTPIQTREQLKSLGFNLVNVEINHLKDIPDAIHMIARTLNTQPNESVNRFLSELNRLKKQPLTQHTALIQISNQPIYTVNGQHWMSEAAEICGLNNIFNDLDNLSAAVTLESVVLKKPAVLIRLEPLQDDHQLAQWPSIPAIANQHIAVLEADHFTRPTLRTLSAIKSLCAQVASF